MLKRPSTYFATNAQFTPPKREVRDVNKFRAKVIDIEVGQNEVVLNEEEAKAMNLQLLDRVKIKTRGKEATAIVNYSHRYVQLGEVEILADLAQQLGIRSGDFVFLEPTQRPKSLDYIRKKLDKQLLSDKEITEIITDLMQEKLSSAELAAFITAVYMDELNAEETTALTKAIYESGDRLEFPNGQIIVSEHSIGGIAGDRTSIILVPLLASLGLTVPKTCTRAISSAAGTADTLEVFCPVSLSIVDIKKVVKKTGCCLVWGGAVNMAVADDKLIKIRNPLHLDPKSLLLASILAKKKAEGSTHVLLDIPIGRGAKILEIEKARELAQDFQNLGNKMGMKIEVVITDGSEPVSYSIGPSLEAREVLKVLKGGDGLLAEKTAIMAGMVLKMVRGVTKEEGYRIALHQLKSGKAYEKFKELVTAQGGNPNITAEDIRIGKLTFDVFADADGKVQHIDNKAISRVCRALGCPSMKTAGMVIHVRLGDKVKKGQKIFTMYTDAKDKLAFEIEQTKTYSFVEIEKIIIESI
ncbi:MAG: AMP phosphorylase [Candidatus Micrarchaeota archaeon]|nr:AMP phosphorylase [Candidatus Micrarchaeota archaeon]